MNLVHEEDGALSHRPAVFGHLDDLAKLGNTTRDSRERDELGFRVLRDEMRQRGLAAARRTPEDDGRQLVRFDGFAERAVRSGNLYLPDKVLEDSRTHPFG